MGRKKPSPPRPISLSRHLSLYYGFFVSMDMALNIHRQGKAGDMARHQQDMDIQ
jgi:hypothetical protein